MCERRIYYFININKLVRTPSPSHVFILFGNLKERRNNNHLNLL